MRPRNWGRSTNSACTRTCIPSHRCISGCAKQQPRLARLTERLLRGFHGHHSAFPAAQVLPFDGWRSAPLNQGIGLTDEYFTHTYQVPSWTLEIEPSSGQHPGLPGPGRRLRWPGTQRPRRIHPAGIGSRKGANRVGADFTVAYYRQSGPPAISAFRLIDKVTGRRRFRGGMGHAGSTDPRNVLHSRPRLCNWIGLQCLDGLGQTHALAQPVSQVYRACPAKPRFTLNFERASYVDGVLLKR